MTMKKLAAVACLCGFAAIAPNLKADLGDKRTVFTFSGPVEIPGQVLSPGSYVFKLLVSGGSRNVVQVFDKDEKHIIGTFLTIADYRMKTPEKPLVTFEERAAGSPEAMKSWFYPGDNYGNEFVYPKVRATELAKQNQQVVPSMPTELASNTTQATTSQSDQQMQQMKTTPLKAQKPTGEEVEVAEVFVVEPVAVAADPVVAQNDSPRLPDTATPLPLFGCLGLLSLAAGFGLRARLQKVS